MALDAKRPPANAAAFGRPGTRRNGQSIDGAYPQWHAVFLSETGTHVVVEAYIKRGKRSEFKVATSLLRKAPSGCLVLQDRGFYGYRPLPPRDNRINPGVVKKKMSNFGKKRPEHYHPPQPQRPFEQSVVILK